MATVPWMTSLQDTASNIQQHSAPGGYRATGDVASMTTTPATMPTMAAHTSPASASASATASASASASALPLGLTSGSMKAVSAYPTSVFGGRATAPAPLTLSLPAGFGLGPSQPPAMVVGASNATKSADGGPTDMTSKVLASRVFQSGIAVLCVFIISLIILIVVRPPFTYVQPAPHLRKERYKRSTFSAGVATLYALGAAALAAAAMGITYAVTKTRPCTLKK